MSIFSLSRPSALQGLWNRASQQTDRREAGSRAFLLKSVKKAATVVGLFFLLAVTTGCAGGLPTTLGCNGITKQTGWNIYAADDPALENRNEVNGVKASYVGGRILEMLKKANVRICIAPAEVKGKVFPEVEACFVPGVNALFLEEGALPDVFVHEGIHAGLQNRTDSGASARPVRLEQQALKRGDVTKHIQLKLAQEAGAFVMQVLRAKQEALKGKHKEWIDVIGREQTRPIASVLDDMVEKDPAFLAALKDSKAPIGAEYVDELMASSFKTGEVFLSHAVMYLSWFVKEGEKSCVGKARDYRAGDFSLEEIQEVTVGPLYPTGTSFPKTREALRHFGEKCEKDIERIVKEMKVALKAQPVATVRNARRVTAASPDAS